MFTAVLSVETQCTCTFEVHDEVKWREKQFCHCRHIKMFDFNMKKYKQMKNKSKRKLTY